MEVKKRGNMELYKHGFSKDNQPVRNGRKKGLERIFKEALTKDDLVSIIQAAKSEALNGNIKAAEFIFDRFYGKPIAVDLSANENRTLIQNNFNIDVSGKSASELIEILQNTQIDDVEHDEITE